MSSLEQSDKEAGAVATAPRVTLKQLNSRIVDVKFGRASDLFGVENVPLSCLTICVITMKNGFTIVGTSACAAPENFNAELGQRLAREDAVCKAWAFEGYLLRDQLSLK